MGSNPYRRLSLLGIAHPVVGLRQGRDCEEGRHVALTILFKKVFYVKRIVIKFFWTIL